MTTKKLLRLPEVMERVGIRAKATIYRWIKAGTFPLPVALGPRLRAWRAADIEDWLDNRPQVDPGVMPGAETRQSLKAAGAVKKPAPTLQ